MVSSRMRRRTPGMFVFFSNENNMKVYLKKKTTSRQIRTIKEKLNDFLRAPKRRERSSFVCFCDIFRRYRYRMHAASRNIPRMKGLVARARDSEREKVVRSRRFALIVCRGERGERGQSRFVSGYATSCCRRRGVWHLDASVCEAYSSRPLRGHATKGTRRHWNARSWSRFVHRMLHPPGVVSPFDSLSDLLNTDASFLFPYFRLAPAAKIK